ncbi:glycosyltransferase [Actinokineospora sp. NPDC004072]
MSGAVVRAAAVAATLSSVHALINARLLRRPSANPGECPESVSLLLPVRDEVHRVGPCLRSLLAQRGVADLEIVVCDDGSTDGTAALVAEIAAGDPRVRLIGSPGPPAGLPGKPYACDLLARHARGRVLVFVDADVELAPHAVAAAVALMRAHGLDAVSPFPRQLAEDAATRLVQPLLQWSWLVFLPLRAAERSPRPSLTAANGQFLVIDAAMLARCGGFAAVADAVLDDIALMRAVKAAGGRGVVVDGSTLAACRMYRGWAQVSAGYEKSLWSATGSPVAAAGVAALLAWMFLVPPLAAATGSRAGLLGYAAGVLGRVVTARASGGRAWPDALAHPVSVAALLTLLGRSWRARRRGTLVWRGRALHGSR